MKMIKDSPDETMTEEAGESKEYEKHEIESAAETLMKAEEIKSNAKLMKCCQEHMSKKSGHLSAAMGKKPGSLKELKQIAKDKEKAAMVDENG